MRDTDIQNPSDPGDWFNQNAPPPPTGPASDLAQMWETAGHDPARFITAYIAAKHLIADQHNHAALQQIVEALNAVDPGHWALDQPDPQGRLEGILHDGRPQQLIGGNGWTPLQDWPTASSGDNSPFNFNIDQYNSNPFTAAWPGSFPTFTKAPPYTPTTGADVLADPGYRFGRDQGEEALQQSAAARGLLNTGGTLKDIYAWGNSYANSFLGNVDARRRADYQTNYTTQVLDPYQNAYKNAMDSYNVWRNRQNDSWDKVFSSNNA